MATTRLAGQTAMLGTELGRLLSGHVQVLLTNADSAGVSQIDLAILRLLAERGDARASFLAEEFAVTRTSVSRHIALLTEAGMISQLADPADGRASLLRLTAAGRRALAADDARRGALVAELTADWSEDERAVLTQLLGRLNDRGRQFLNQPRRPVRGGSR